MPERRRVGRIAVLGAALAVAGCTRRADLAVAIPFIATINGQAFSCSTAAGDFSPADLRFYVHGIDLIDNGGAAVPLALDADGEWQSGGVALVDFENGADHCADGTRGTHTAVTGHAPPGHYVGLRFVLGVPFDRNHADPVEAEPPLNLGRMHWGWQGGYKFFRFEGEDATGAFRLHLGSTACEGTIGHITRCSHPNRAAIRLDGFTPGRSTVRLELAPLLRALQADAPPGSRTFSCMSDVDDRRCHAPFAALGLDPVTGASTGAQVLFSAQA